MTRTTSRCLLALVMLLDGGCSSPEPDGAKELLGGAAIGKVTQLQLREELKDYADRFALTVSGVANEILSESSDRSMCVSAIYWQLFTIPSCRRSAVSPNPIAGLVDMWSFLRQLVGYFETYPVFGERTSLALEATRALEADIATIAAEIIPPQHLGKVQAALDEFVRDHPIAGSFARRSPRPAMVKASDAKSLTWVTELPLAPLRVFMDEHAKAIRDFTLVADSLLTYAQSVPDTFRWQTQLLLYDLESRDTTLATLSELKAGAEGIQSLATAARELPAGLGREVTAALDAVEARQAGLRETLKEVQTTLAAADETLAGATTVALTLEKTTESWNEAGARWEKAVDAADRLVSRFTDDEEKAEAGGAPVQRAPEEERTFDIRDYTETAVRAEAAAVRLQALTAEARALLESDAAAALIDRIVWGAALVIACFFGSLLAYRVVVTRLARRPDGVTPTGKKSPMVAESDPPRRKERLDRSLSPD